MTRAAKATLTAAAVVTGFIVYGVHWLQEREEQTMYQGVLRDDERRRQKMLKRQQELQETQRVPKAATPSGQSPQSSNP